MILVVYGSLECGSMKKKIKTSTKKLAEHFFVHLCNTNLKLIIYQCFFISWTFLCQFQDLQNERANISSWFTANFTVLLEMNILKLLLKVGSRMSSLSVFFVLFALNVFLF